MWCVVLRLTWPLSDCPQKHFIRCVSLSLHFADEECFMPFSFLCGRGFFGLVSVARAGCVGAFRE